MKQYEIRHGNGKGVSSVVVNSKGVATTYGTSPLYDAAQADYLGAFLATSIPETVFIVVNTDTNEIQHKHYWSP